MRQVPILGMCPLVPAKVGTSLNSHLRGNEGMKCNRRDDERQRCRQNRNRRADRFWR
jgi:hypothetical protein